MLTPEWRDRICCWINELKKHFYIPVGIIDMAGFTTYEQLTADEAGRNKFKPMPIGTEWGAKWEYGWFKGEITLPDETAGKRIVMYVNTGGESTVYIDGKAAGNKRADWIKEEHHYISDLCLCREGKPGKRYEILVESYAGHGPRLESGGPVPPGRDSVPQPGKTQVTIGESTFGIWNEAAYQLWLDV